MTSQDISELIERVRAAAGPDHEIGIDVLIALDPFYGKAARRSDSISAMLMLNADPTVSIDAALALVERCLPGWGIEIGIPAKRGGVGNSRLYPGDHRNAEMTYFGSAQTPALAILLALLTALQSTHSGQMKCPK